MEILLFIVGAIVCYLVSTMIHEMGHVVCGLLHHWKLYMLVVGPLKLYRESMDSMTVPDTKDYKVVVRKVQRTQNNSLPIWSASGTR